MNKKWSTTIAIAIAAGFAAGQVSFANEHKDEGHAPAKKAAKKGKHGAAGEKSCGEQGCKGDAKAAGAAHEEPKH